MIKLNCTDFLEGGLETTDAVLAAKLLDREGIDAIEVSGGTPASGEQTPARMRIKAPSQEAYHLSYASQIRKAVNCPIMVVGGFRSIKVIEAALQEGGADYISMSRPFIREPNLASRWQEGDREPARCISCNSCFNPGLKEGGIYCVVEKKLREKNKDKND
jgi:2,4-dienoyl-CoA reductase-like NADH-dependent reductase (Old Yellow Enzyme family)